MATLRNTLVILRHGLTSLSALKTAAESRVKSERFGTRLFGLLVRVQRLDDTS